MLRTALLLATAVSMFLPQVGYAQNNDDGKLKVGDYAPDFEAEEWVNADDEDIPSLAELRGMVVVIFFWVARHEGGESLLTFVNQYENSERGRTNGVYTLGLTDANRKATERISQANMAFFPMGVQSKSAAEYGLDSGFGFVVVDAEGKLAFRSDGGDLSGVVSAVNDAISKSPPTKTHPREARKVRTMLDAARKLMREGRYRRAFEIARDAIGRAVTGDPLRQQIVDLLDLLEALGNQHLDRVGPLMDGRKYREAADTLRMLQRDFAAPLTPGLDARDLYERYQKDYRGFKEAVLAHKAEDEAANIYLDARDDLRARRFGESYTKLIRLQTDYPDTKAAQYAEEMIGRMKANPDFWGLVLDHQAKNQCELWLAQVRSHMSRRRYSEARKLLERIREDYPNTVYDVQARELLIEMPG